MMVSVEVSPFAAPAFRSLATIRHRVRQLPLSSKVTFGAVGLIIAITLLGGVFAPHSAIQPSGDPLVGPSASHWFGTDEIGRDIFSRVLVGLRSSWWGSLAVIASGLVFGGFVGLVSGSIGGLVDTILMRLTDAFLALPGGVLAVAVVAAIGPSYRNTLMAISIVFWPTYARMMRSEVRRLKASPHVDAARLAGTSPVRLAVRHLLPGAIPPLMVAATLDVGALIIGIAGLSFLGLGSPAPAPELGSMAYRGMTYINESWWVPIFPALAVFFLAVVANFAGDAVRDQMKDR